AAGADVKLTPLVLTQEQVRHYSLPRVPIKEADSRRGNFEQAYGEGAVELDALEALFPGRLENLVRAAVAPYRDTTFEERLAEAAKEANQAVREQWQEATADLRKQLKAGGDSGQVPGPAGRAGQETASRAGPNQGAARRPPACRGGIGGRLHGGPAAPARAR